MEVVVLSLDISGIEELPNYNLGDISNIPNTFLFFLISSNIEDSINENNVLSTLCISPVWNTMEKYLNYKDILNLSTVNKNFRENLYSLHTSEL